MSERKFMRKIKKIIGLALLSGVLMSGCRNSSFLLPKLSESSYSESSSSFSYSVSSLSSSEMGNPNTEPSEIDNYEYFPLLDGTLSIAVGDNRDLEELTIPRTYHGKMVTQIAENGFDKCLSLKEINIPDSITKIQNKAFLHCIALKKINIPSSVLTIGEYAFFGCSLLEHVEIHEGITSIGNHAFVECTSLNIFLVPESVTSLGESVFQRCENLTIFCKAKDKPDGWDPYWDGGVRYVWGCDDAGIYQNYAYGINIKNSERYVTIYRYLGNESDIVIPSIIDGMEVIGIGDSAFGVCSSLVSVIISQGITFIGPDAFFCCRFLESVVIPSSVTSIGKNAFFECGLKSVTIPSSVALIGIQAFFGCYSLKNVVISEGVLSIGESAFSRCSKLARVEIPESVMSIGKEAFSYCESLKSIRIPKSVTSIGEDAFLWCSSSMTIFCQAERKPKGWIYGWNGNSSVLWGCDGGGNYRNFIYRVDVKNEERFATILGYSGKESDIIIPSTIDGIKVKRIDDEAFSYCDPMESVVISEGITSIGSSAFQGCSNLTRVVIPKSVTSIGSNSFYECSSKMQVFCKAENKPDGWDDDWVDSNYIVNWGYKE